jgi:uncharacterized membrane protein YuzA (DUF378 family)
MFLTFLVIVGGLNWGSTALGYNFVHMFSQWCDVKFQRSLNIESIVYILVGMASIILLFRRSTWLPFLGQTVVPPALIPISTNLTGNTTIEIDVKPKTKIMYWVSKHSTSNKPVDVMKAYDNYSNSGVVLSDINGKAQLTFDTPNGYTIGGRFIHPHVHYRELNEQHAMIGPVKTYYL